MAPTTIAINQQEAPEVSPMREPEFGEQNRELYQKYCQQEKSIQSLRSKYKEAKHRLDRMRTEGSAQKKMILDMSDIVEALKSISVENEGAAEDGENPDQANLDQITKKIQAIDKQLKTSMLHTVQLEELKKITSTTISDQEAQIKNLENQVSLMEARLQHSETHRDIMLPDTSYEAQLSNMQDTIVNLQSKIKSYEYDRGHNGVSVVKPNVIDLTDASNDPPASKDSTASCTTEDGTSNPSSDPNSLQDDYREAKERIEELENANKKMNEDLAESIDRMSEVTESATDLQNDLFEMAQKLKEAKQANEKLLDEKRESDLTIEKLEAEVAEAETVKKDFEELERTVIAKVEQLEGENSLLQQGQEKAATKIMDLTAALTESEDAQAKLKEVNNKLHLELSENSKLLEQLSNEASENEQARADFEELEKTVIARVEELEKENMALKQEKEESQSTARSIDTTKAIKMEREEIDEKLSHLEKLEKQNNDYMEDVRVLAEENSTLKVQSRELEEKNDLLNVLVNELQTEILEVKENAENVNEEVSEVRAVAIDLEKKYAESQRSANETSEELEKAKDEVAALEKEKETVTETQTQLQDELDKKKETIEELKNKSAEANASFQDLEEENRRLMAAMKDLEEENDRLSFSQQEQSRDSAVLNHPWGKKAPSKTMRHALESENEKLREENDENLSRIAALTNSLDDKDTQIMALQETMELMTSLETENSKLKSFQEEREMRSKEGDASRVRDLEDQNKRLKETMVPAEEAQKLRSDYHDMQTKLREVNQKLMDLQNKSSRTLDDGDSVSQDATVGSQYSARDMEAFNRLKSMHQAVAMKLADLGEENATLKDQLDETQSKVTKQQETIVVLQTIKEDYARLMDEYHHTVEKLNAKEESSVAMLTLQQEYADARAKMTVLQWENDELSRSKAMYHNAEARIATLERQVMEANENLSAEKQKGTYHVSNTREVIEAYKELEAEHEEVTEKVQMLQSLMEGEENKEGTGAKGAVQASELALMERQRNAAWKQVRALEDKVSMERKNASALAEARNAREGDLKLVLQEYESIQRQYEKVMKRVDSLKAKNSELKTKNRDLKAKNHQMAKRQRALLSQREQQQQLTEIPEEKPIEIIVLDEEGEPDSPATEQEAMNLATTEEEEDIDEPENDDNDGEEEELADDGSTAPRGISNELVAIWKNFGISKKKKKQSGARVAGGAKTSTGPRQPTTNATSTAASSGDDVAEVVVTNGNSCGGGDQQSVISRISTHLELQQEAEESEHLRALEERHDQAVAKLERMEGELLLAQREAEDAKKTEVSKEIKLRDATAKLFKLEREHHDLQGVVMSLRSHLSQAKKEARAAEAEVKGMRKRLDERNVEYKELQEKHDAFMQRFSEEDASKMDELVKDNESMNALCKEYLTTLAEIKDDKGSSVEAEESSEP